MKKNFTLFILLGVITVFLFNRCDKSVDPVIDSSIVPQYDIVWESLADSPWPMFHHDPQSTGRSKYRGPQNGIIEKKVYVGMMDGGISIGRGGKIYLCQLTRRSFNSLDYSGNLVWKLDEIWSSSTPLLANGNIYIAGVDSFRCFSENGEMLWGRNNRRTICVSPAVDKNGNLYYIDIYRKLYVYDKDGNKLWEMVDERFLRNDDVAPSFSPDGNTLYIQGETVSVLALDINSKTIKWTFGDKMLRSSPVIDNAGNIYIIPEGYAHWGEKTIYSLYPSGNIRWEFKFGGEIVMDNTEPTIDYNGNLYFGNDTLFSLTNNGDLRWKRFLDSALVYSPLISDNENTVYVGAVTRSGYNTAFAYTEKGERKWKIEDSTKNENSMGVSPAISETGLIFYPTWNNYKGNYYIIK